MCFFINHRNRVTFLSHQLQFPINWDITSWHPLPKTIRAPPFHQQGSFSLCLHCSCSSSTSVVRNFPAPPSCHLSRSSLKWNLFLTPLPAFILMDQVSHHLLGFFCKRSSPFWASSPQFCTPLIESSSLGTGLYAALHRSQSLRDGLCFSSFLLEIAHSKHTWGI